MMNDSHPFLLDPSLFQRLQRTRHDPFSSVSSGALTAAPPTHRRQLYVRGIGLKEKAADESTSSETPIRPFERLLVGLFEGKVPLSFQVEATPASVRFFLGVWTPNEVSPGARVPGLAEQEGVIVSLLRGVYPFVDIADSILSQPRPWPRSGLALGVPSLPAGERSDPALPIERLARALTGKAWSLLVLAQPVLPELTDQVRDRVLNEMRMATAAAAA